MDLSRLRNALNDPKRKGDVDLQASFRSSALHLTQFLKTAQLGQEKAYQQGYADALSDVLGVIHAGLDMPTKGISQVIDWIDARQEALAADSSEAEIDEDPTPPAPTTSQEEPTPIPSTSAIPQHSPPTPQPITGPFNFSCPLPSTSSVPSSSTSTEPTPITRLAKHKMRKHLKSRAQANAANQESREQQASGSGENGQDAERPSGRKRSIEEDPMALFEEHVRPAKRVARR